MDKSWCGVPYVEFNFEGYHTEVSGNGYDLLIREEDDKVIARYEGDYYDEDILGMATGNYKDTDYSALSHFYNYCR